MLAENKGQETSSSFTRLLRNSVLAFVVGGTAALFAYCLHSWEREEREVRDNLLIQSNFLASISDSFFDNMGNGLGSLGQLLDKCGVLHNPQGCRPLLVDFQNRHPEVASMAVFATDGEMLVNTAVNPGDPLPDFRKDPPYLRQLLKDMVNQEAYTVGAPEFGKAIRRWRFAVRHVVRNADGVPRYMVQAAIPLEREGTFLHEMPMPPNSFIGLMRSDGRHQARWPIDDPDSVYADMGDGQLAQMVRTVSTLHSGYVRGEAYWPQSREHRVVAFTRLGRGDMLAFVSAPWIYVWKQWWSHNAAVLLVSLLFLLAAFLVAHRIWRRERLHRQELLSQARRDALTGLPNRAAAEEMMQFCIDMSHTLDRKFSLLIVDIDRFKDVNDSLGHATGDRLLVDIARLIKESLRDEGTLCRLGGDEFLVVLPARGLDVAVDVAERLIEAFKQPIKADEHSLQVTPSIGIAQFPEHGTDIYTLLKHADTAMYEAKHLGRNRFSVYMDELGERVTERVKMEQLLREALQENLFQLVYQPVVDMRGGRIVGAEALVRWVRADGTVVMPKHFIGVAEESGLIIPLGEWVLHTALAQVNAWNKAGHDLWVSVNISPRQFQDPRLVEKISAALRQSGVSPERLGVEITETVAMLNQEASTRILGGLKALGVRIAIDDFGTGYSSLSYLKRIPADMVKIDKSFVDGIDLEADDTAIVHTILALAGVLGKAVVAEGVETEEQYNALRALNCQLAQGNWIGRPLPPGEFAAELNRRRQTQVA
ncbi:MAG: EAL domain-containing protein [Pseudomonadota bacterium]